MAEPEPSLTPIQTINKFYIPEEAPTAADIVLPPLMFMAVITIGILSLMLKSHLQRLQLSQAVKRTERSTTDVQLQQLPPGDQLKSYTGSFLTEGDLKALEDLCRFSNKPMNLIKVALPALLSLAICPILLLLYKPMMEFFWDPEKYNGTPNINDAVACYLAPAGLVYATTFGFSFQYALDKQQLLRDIISDEISLLDQIVIVTSHLHVKAAQKCRLLTLVKDELISMALQIQHRVENSCAAFTGTQCGGQVWQSTHVLSQVDTGSASWGLNRLLMGHFVELLLRLNGKASHRIQTLTACIHPLQWIFLEILGICSFFGIVLIKTYSYNLDLTMCNVTCFSIATLSYLIADLDSPFNGVFRIQLDALPEMIDKVNFMYEMTEVGVNVSLPYHVTPSDRSKVNCVIRRRSVDPTVCRLTSLSNLAGSAYQV